MPAEPRAGSPWGVHDHPDAHQTERGAGQVEAVGAEPVDEHTPGEGPRHEDAAVRGEDPAEVGVVLERGDEPVEPEGDDPGADPGDAALLAHALPHEPRA